MKINGNKMMERMSRYVMTVLAMATISLVPASCGGSDGDGYDDETEDYETGGGGSGSNSAAYQQAVNMINQFWMGSDSHRNSIWLVFSENGTVSERFNGTYGTEGTWEFCNSSYDQVRFSSNLNISSHYGQIYNVSYTDNGRKMTLYNGSETLAFNRIGDGSGGDSGDSGGSSGSGGSSSINYISTSVLEVYVQYTPYSSTPIVETSYHSWHKASVNGKIRLYKSTKSPYDYILADSNHDVYQEGVSVGSYRYKTLELGTMPSVYHHYYFN